MRILRNGPKSGQTCISCTCIFDTVLALWLTLPGLIDRLDTSSIPIRLTKQERSNGSRDDHQGYPLMCHNQAICIGLCRSKHIARLAPVSRFHFEQSLRISLTVPRKPDLGQITDSELQSITSLFCASIA